MDNFVNKIFKEHFDHVREIKWVKFNIFASQWKRAIKNAIKSSLKYDYDEVSIEGLICPVTSHLFDSGASGGLDGKCDFRYKIPKTVIFEYKLNTLECVTDISVLKQMKKIPIDTSPEELLEIYNRINDGTYSSSSDEN